MKTRWSIPALGAFFVLMALAVSACGGSGVPSGDVATVDGNPISTRAVDHWMYVVEKQQAASNPSQPVIVPNDPPNFSKCVAQVRAEIPALKSTPAKQVVKDCKQLFTSLSGQVLDFLIRSYWYQAEAHKQHLTVTPAQVERAVAAARQGGFKTNAEFLAYLASSGQTNADVTYRIKIQQIYSKLLAKHPTTVTNAAIAAYFTKHASSFATPASRNMRIVLAKTAGEAAAAKAALSHGKSWQVVAKKYSIDPTTKNTGGLLTGVTKGQQDAALATVAFGPTATVGKVLGPIKGQFGYYVVQVIKINPAKARTLAQSTTAIKQQLTTQLQTAAQTAVNNAAKSDYLSKTSCDSAYAMADCSGYKAPKSSSSAAAAG